MGLATDGGAYVRGRYGSHHDGSIRVDGADRGAVADLDPFGGSPSCQIIYVQLLELRNGHGRADAVKDACGIEQSVAER